MCNLCHRRRVAYLVTPKRSTMLPERIMTLRSDKMLVCKPCKDKLQGEVSK